jgi:hypothetical protein
MTDQTPLISGARDTTFGTSGVLTDEAFANAIVKSARFTPAGDEINEAGNSGTTKVTVLLNDGWDAEITCVHDSGIAWPAKGDEIAVKNPEEDVARTCLVLSVTPDLDRKACGSIVLRCNYRPDRAAAVPAP